MKKTVADLEELWEAYSHTVVGLKDYVDMRFAEAEKARRDSLAALDAMRSETARVMDKRLDAMNEFRGALRDQADQMMPRTEYTLKHEQLDAKIDALEKFRDQLEGKASQASVYWSYAIAAISIILTLVKFFVK